MLKQIDLDQRTNNLGKKTVQTSENLSHFSDFISRAEKKGQYLIHHATTFPDNNLAGVPTDHAAVKSIKNGYHIVVADGMGHTDPVGIGQVAAEVVEHVLSDPLSSRLNQIPDQTHQENYVNYVKELHKA